MAVRFVAWLCAFVVFWMMLASFFYAHSGAGFLLMFVWVIAADWWWELDKAHRRRARQRQRDKLRERAAQEAMIRMAEESRRRPWYN